MITIPLDNTDTKPFYIQIYEYIRKEILNGNIAAQEKLPSARNLAANLNVSRSTVDNAYDQLVAEGYIYSIPKSGYYVTDISADLMKPLPERPAKQFEKPKEKKTYFADFASNSTVEDAFPFSICQSF